MTQSLHGRQLQASLKLGEALRRLRIAGITLSLARGDEEFDTVHNTRLAGVARELDQAIAAIEAAVKEG